MAKNTVMVFGAVLVIVGVWGFFQKSILGTFDVNTLHNIIHLASGILAIAFAMRGEAGAVTFAKVFGIIYALVAILGFVAGDFMRSLVNSNRADHWLHVVLALVFLFVGFGSKPAVTSNPNMGGMGNGGMGNGMNS